MTSSFFVFIYASVALPVTGVGFLAGVLSLAATVGIFAAVISAMATLTWHWVGRTEPSEVGERLPFSRVVKEDANR